MSKSCEYCDPRRSVVCGSQSVPGPFVYECTREPGHDGVHVACGTVDHVIETWPNVDTPSRDEKHEEE